MTLRSATVLALALLAGCSGLSREDRIADRLERAGLKPRLSRCMAGKLARDLSNDELARLAEIAKAPASDGGKPGRKALLRRIDAIGDPHISDTVSRAAIGCAIMG